MNNKTRGIAYFLFIAFGLAWVIWGVPLLKGASALSPGFQNIQFAGSFAPLLAAVFVRYWITREGFADTGYNIRIKKAWRYYIVALLVPLGVVVVTTLLAMLSGAGQPDFSLGVFLRETVPPGQEPPAPGLNIWIGLVLQLIFASGFLTLFSIGQEFGWRGYLQIRLLAERPLLAAVATGLIWGVWYAPLNLAGYFYEGQPVLGALLFPVTTVLLSIIFGWLFLRSGSIWTPSLAYAASVNLGGAVLEILFGGHSDLLITGYFGVLSWVPLGAICLWIILTHRLEPRPAVVPPTEKPDTPPETPGETKP